MLCSQQADLFGDAQQEPYLAVRQSVLHNTLYRLQQRRQPSLVIRAEDGVPVGANQVILHNNLHVRVGLYRVEMRTEEDGWCACDVRRQASDDVIRVASDAFARFIALNLQSQPLQAGEHRFDNLCLLLWRTVDATQRDKVVYQPLPFDHDAASYRVIVILLSPRGRSGS
ncbi:hypothetical protein HRbin16_02900 [bacterium HR16]|nr:hypothetical protein HRbin16_02900 [bacterium HR16]